MSFMLSIHTLPDRLSFPRRVMNESWAHLGRGLNDSWTHRVVGLGTCRQYIVAEGHAEITLRIELKSGELLERADFVNGWCTRLQIDTAHAKLCAPHDKRVRPHACEGHLVASETALDGLRNAIHHTHGFTRTRERDSQASLIHHSFQSFHDPFAVATNLENVKRFARGLRQHRLDRGLD